MTQEEMLTALYEKMAAEQDKYRDWLKGQPAAEVLNHAYEYTVREDIVMCMEELELTEAQAKALLASPAPLADVYKDFEKLETSYMDVIRDTIETRANELYQAQETLKNTPLYPHSAAYASEHGEMAQYNASFQASHACKEAIEQAIGRHYSNNRLDAEAAVNDVLEQFGADRVQYVLANTVRHKEWDGRISRDNKAWASTMPMPEGSPQDRNSEYLVVDHCNPGLTDLFLKQVRQLAGERENPLSGRNCKRLRRLPGALPRPGRKRRSVDMANREREIQLKFRVTPEERELIEAKMAQLGTQNMAAYLRKMALDGYVVRLELPELREMVSLLRRSSNNLNQLTRRVHETGRIYDADLEDLRQGQEKLWEAAEHILSALAALK